jgi:hypothetical protein
MTSTPVLLVRPHVDQAVEATQHAMVHASRGWATD